jgi:hypothetical protein
LQSSKGKFSAYGKHVAQELESLPNEMAMFCRRDINEVIFEAQMGTLNRTSCVVTDPHYPQPTSTPHEYVYAEPPSHISNPTTLWDNSLLFSRLITVTEVSDCLILFKK